VLEQAGAFNYSKLSNAGARATKAPYLVFLNNDVQILDSNWLKNLMRWAVKPGTGAVGAKLLFPNGKIQHAGVVLGMGGIAGHVYRRSHAALPGYLQQLRTTREVLAVTGACLATERKKFDAVGGFEEEHLPVDLNDIDLCLRLAERGWTNLWTPDATLIHVQSASRGIERDPFELYRRERSYFTRRWGEALRDDPYFHPAFSLFSQTPMLA
ncbi:MAG: glycosyltransferase, partial [Candidatus Binataceae bacterium]